MLLIATVAVVVAIFAAIVLVVVGGCCLRVSVSGVVAVVSGLENDNFFVDINLKNS